MAFRQTGCRCAQLHAQPLWQNNLGLPPLAGAGAALSGAAAVSEQPPSWLQRTMRRSCSAWGLIQEAVAAGA